MAIVLGERADQHRLHPQGGVIGTDALKKQQFAVAPYTGDVQPSNRYVGMLWVDSTFTPHILKRWNGTAWVIIGSAGVVSVSGSAPITINNTDPTNPVVEASTMIAAGASHARGVVGDPGATPHTPPYYWGDDAAFHAVGANAALTYAYASAIHASTWAASGSMVAITDTLTVHASDGGTWTGSDAAALYIPQDGTYLLCYRFYGELNASLSTSTHVLQIAIAVNGGLGSVLGSTPVPVGEGLQAIITCLFVGAISRNVGDRINFYALQNSNRSYNAFNTQITMVRLNEFVSF